MRTAFLFLTVFCTATSAHAQELRCEILQKYVCEAAGCKSVPAKVWNLVDAAKRIYARCDSNGCDKYDAQFSVSGTFINIDVLGRGLTAKVATDGSSFHEVATLTHVIYVSFGSCRRT